VIKKIYEDNCVDICWEKGDVVVVDNLAVQARKAPWEIPTGGARISLQLNGKKN